MEALRQSVERNRAARKAPAAKSTAKKTDGEEDARPRRLPRRRPGQEEGGEESQLAIEPGESVYCVNMGIGIGIVLIVIGAILLFALKVDIPFFTDDTLGIILIVGGVLALVVALVHATLSADGPSTSRRTATRAPPPSRRQPCIKLALRVPVDSQFHATGSAAARRASPIDQVMWVRIGARTPPPARRCSPTTAPSTAAAKTSTGLPPATVARV